jgi:hypothetical protein
MDRNARISCSGGEGLSAWYYSGDSEFALPSGTFTVDAIGMVVTSTWMLLSQCAPTCSTAKGSLNLQNRRGTISRIYPEIGLS